MDKPQSMIDYLIALSKIFDALNENITRIDDTKNRMEHDLSSFKNLELSDPKALEQLEQKFSPKKLMLLMKIFFQITKFAETHSLGIEKKIKDYNDASQLVKEINNDLKELLRDEN